MYMVRQLASALGLADQLASAGERYANTGSCSVPLAIASSSAAGRALVAGFGAGLSASVGIVRLADGAFRGGIE
jgi:3-oxoacyl-[acyl-carrier-protein] synthase III